MVFERKNIAVRQRLGVMRQIINAPIMYVSAITECLRRNTMQPVSHFFQSTALLENFF